MQTIKVPWNLSGSQLLSLCYEAALPNATEEPNSHSNYLKKSQAIVLAQTRMKQTLADAGSYSKASEMARSSSCCHQ